MKSKITAIAFFGISILSGQEMFTASGGEHIPPAQNSVCLSDEKRLEILDGLELNRQQLIDQGLLQPLSAVQNMVHPLFQWPVVKNPDSPYNDVWSISNHVDHNAAFPNLIQDY
ncbi:MAG: hypothetical protein ITG00_01330, partial [Flavobacterium sp.]|nr:hypothetical protein [Flavobacterium sp.]